MVNVAGRSKGCSTCRKRRVKCDETRPICERCRRGGLQCDGPKGTAFIEAAIVASRRSEKRSPIPSKYDPRAISYVRCQIPLSLPLTGHDIDIYLCYTLKHLRGGPVELALQGVDRGDIVAARQSAASGHIFHQAIVSFAAIFFGMQHKQSSITNHGYAILGTSLARLNRALSDSKNCVSDDVLLSVITLALLESFVPSSPRQYLNHMLALEKLLELRGPSLVSPGLLRGVRYMILFGSLRTRKPSILARADWKSVLREGCSKDDTQEQDLFDVIADCTVLFAGHRQTSTPPIEDQKIDFHRQAKAEHTASNLLFYLYTWRMRWNADEKNFHREVPWIVPVRSTSWESFENCIPQTLTVLEFTDMSAAMLLMLYNTALIYVLQILDMLSCELPSTHLTQSLTNNSWPHARQSDIEHSWKTLERSAALDSCRCIPYLARQPSLDLRVIHLAATTVWTTLRGDDSPESIWMRHVLNTNGQEMIARGLRPDDHNPAHDSNGIEGIPTVTKLDMLAAALLAQ